MSATWVGVVLIGLAALLYSSVGHGGASGYLAVMALLGVAAVAMRPAALVLNIVVATIGTTQFARAGYFRWRLFAPFAVASIPAAYLGGRIVLPGAAYRILVGVVLIVSALRLVVTLRAADQSGKQPPLPVCLVVGALLGFLAGLSGVGGGIFLSPLLLLAGWADLRTTAATSAAFILVNSIAGLLGQWPSLDALPSEIVWWAPAVVAGGVIGSRLGSQRLAVPALRVLLAAVLLVAGLKLSVSG